MSDSPNEYFDLTGKERRQLHGALLSGFDKRSDLAKLVSFELEEKLDAIAGGDNLSETILDLIEWAEAQGRVLQLARAANREVPANTRIESALKVLEAAAKERAKTDWAAIEPGSDPVEHQQTRKRQVTVSTPSASLGQLQIVHNVMVTHPRGLAPGQGMSLSLPGTVKNAAGRSLQIAVRFMFPNGQYLLAHPQEPAYRDATNYCATGTAAIPVASDSVDLSGFTITIPYYCLNLNATNGMMVYQLSAIASVYIDNVLIGQSTPMPFPLRW